jgi:hypothetical protein
MSCIPPPRLRLLVYQTSIVSVANPCTSTQYVCPACSVGLILEVYEVTAGCEELGRFETCHDSSTVPGTPLDVLFIRLITAPLVPLMLLRARATVNTVKVLPDVNGAAM